MEIVYFLSMIEIALFRNKGGIVLAHHHTQFIEWHSVKGACI